MLFDKQETPETQIQNEYWDSFEDGLKRSKRITDQERYRQSVNNSVKDSYRYLLNKRFTVDKIAQMMIEKFFERFSMQFDLSKKLNNELFILIEGLKSSGKRHNEIDVEVVERLTDEFCKLLKQ